MRFKTKLILAAALLAGASTPAFAADNAMQACGKKYQADKAGGKVPAGQTWNQYLAACRKTLTPAAAAAPVVSKPAVAMTAPVAKTAPAANAGGRMPTAGQTAAHDRQKQCGTMWKADKAAGKIPAGQTWPKYWSQCNTKLKG